MGWSVGERPRRAPSVRVLEHWMRHLKTLSVEIAVVVGRAAAASQRREAERRRRRRRVGVRGRRLRGGGRRRRRKRRRRRVRAWRSRSARSASSCEERRRSGSGRGPPASPRYVWEIGQLVYGSRANFTLALALGFTVESLRRASFTGMQSSRLRDAHAKIILLVVACMLRASSSRRSPPVVRRSADPQHTVPIGRGLRRTPRFRRVSGASRSTTTSASIPLAGDGMVYGEFGLAFLARLSGRRAARATPSISAGLRPRGPRRCAAAALRAEVSASSACPSFTPRRSARAPRRAAGARRDAHRSVGYTCADLGARGRGAAGRGERRLRTRDVGIRGGLPATSARFWRGGSPTARAPALSTSSLGAMPTRASTCWRP